MQKKGKDNSTIILVSTIITTLILSFISFIPYRQIGNVSIKRANLLSDMVNFDDEIVSVKTSKDILDTSFLLDIKKELKGDLSAVNSTKHASNKINDDITPAETSQKKVAQKSLPMPSSDPVAIEDFSDNGNMMTRFYEALVNQSKYRTVRIAFLGDSFIESDIITADFREQLQNIYGGGGVGFVPFANPLSKYRPTISHKYESWDYYNILKKKKTPECYQHDFFVSGMLCIAQQGATAEFTGNTYKKHISNSSTAKLLFKSRGESELKVVVNNTDTLNYTPTPDNNIQQIEITLNKGIHSLAVSLPKCDDFIGYGVVFENSHGVSVHNYGLRSNSGLALFSTNQDINRQIDQLMNYDLVVLEYGLNVMQNDVTDYTYYGNQLRRLIDYVKQCFPSSAILVMSVGDVGMKQNDRIITSPAVEHMIAAQRTAAFDKGVAFWNLYNVMGGENSMQQFVAQGWASKDYTHINHKGGRVIAGKLFNTMTTDIKQIGNGVNTAYTHSSHVVFKQSGRNRINNYSTDNY